VRVGRRLGELGLYQHLVKGHVATLCAVREILGYYAPLADAVFAVQGLCLTPLRKTKRDALGVQMISGERIGGFALTEPEAGSDVASMRTTAKREGSSWILDGEKTLISNVGIAHHFVVFANADPARGRKGISAFLVPADAHGIELVRIPLSGHHPLGRIVLSSCRVPEDALLGEVGQGLSLALGTLEIFRTSVGAAANGMAWRALEETIAHVKQRVQFGKPLADLQLVQAAIAEMITELHASRFLVASAACHLDAGAEARSENGRRVSMAKMHATESAQRIIDRAVQLHGGSGVVLGSKVEELYREIRPLRIYEGATDVLKLIIAQSVLT
jgi:acyl-CoA dehydrogenase